MDNKVLELLKQNEKILSAIRCHKNLDKTSLGKMLDVSWPTVSKFIDDLKGKNIIVIEGKENIISMNKDAFYTVGISIGSSLCKVCIVNANFEIISQPQFRILYDKIHKKFADNISSNDMEMKKIADMIQDQGEENYIHFYTPRSKSVLKQVVDYILCAVEEIVSDEAQPFFEKIISIGFSCTGIVDNKVGKILKSFNIPYLDNEVLETLIFENRQSFFSKNNISINLEQNSNAALVAEKQYSYQLDLEYKSRKNFACIYLGAGLGAGLALGNKLFRGTSNYLGEIGHIPAPVVHGVEVNNENVDDVDDVCKCGNIDCYDLAIRSNVFHKSFDDFSMMNSNDIREYLIANPDALKLLGTYMGDLVNKLTGILNLDLVIFSGKFYQCMDSLFQYISLERDKSSLSYLRNDCIVRQSSIGPIAPTIGAAICSYYSCINEEIEWI